MIWRADPKGLFLALCDSVHLPQSSSSVYLSDSLWFGQKPLIFEQTVTQNLRETRVVSSVQLPQRLPVLQRRSRRGYLRCMSDWQCSTCADPVLPCATGVPHCLLPSFQYCFAACCQPVYPAETTFLCLHSASVVWRNRDCSYCISCFHSQFPIAKVN